MFLLSRAINRGDLRSAGISRFIAKPLRSYWSPSLASASFGRLLLRWSAILGYYPFDPRCFHQGPLGAFPMLAWLLHRRCHARCCLGPRGAGRYSSLTYLPFRLRSLGKDRHNPKIRVSRGYVSDSGHTPFTSLDSRIPLYIRAIRYRAADYTLPGRACAFALPLDAGPAPGSNLQFLNSSIPQSLNL